MKKVFIVGEEHIRDRNERDKLIIEANEENFFIGTEQLIYPMMSKEEGSGFDDFIVNLYTTINGLYFNLLEHQRDSNPAWLSHNESMVNSLGFNISWVKQNQSIFIEKYNQAYSYSAGALTNSLKVAEDFLGCYRRSSDKSVIIKQAPNYLLSLIPIIKTHVGIDFSNDRMLNLSFIKTFETADSNTRNEMIRACLVELRDKTCGFIISALIIDAKRENKDAIFIVGNEHLQGIKSYLQGLNLDADYCNNYTDYRGNRSQEFKNKGNAFFRQAHYQNALECYNRAVRLNVNFKEAWYNKAKTHHKLGYKSEAVNSVKKAIEIDPNYQNAVDFLRTLEQDIPKGQADKLKKFGITSNNAEDYKNKGNKFFKQANYQDALECYKLAVCLNVNFKEAWYNKARAHHKLGYKSEAVNSVKKAIEIDPNYQNAVNFLRTLQREREEAFAAAISISS